MRIIRPPVLLGDRLCRIVSPIESLLEVEEWTGAWWEPSSVTLTAASLAPEAPAATLRERGVPAADCVPGPRSADTDIQALMQAQVSYRANPLEPEQGHSSRQSGSRRKLYAGNARFRRGRGPRPDADEPRDARADQEASAWPGPFRRSSDSPPSPGRATP